MKMKNDQSVVFVAIELTDNSIRDIFESFEMGRKYVERMGVERWMNPLLIVLTAKEFKKLADADKVGFNGLCFQELDSDELPDLDERALAIPMRKGKPIPLGYGYSFADVIEANREKWANRPVVVIDDEWLEGTRNEIDELIANNEFDEPDDDGITGEDKFFIEQMKKTGLDKKFAKAFKDITGADTSGTLDEIYDEVIGTKKDDEDTEGSNGSNDVDE